MPSAASSKRKRTTTTDPALALPRYDRRRKAPHRLCTSRAGRPYGRTLYSCENARHNRQKNLKAKANFHVLKMSLNCLTNLIRYAIMTFASGKVRLVLRVRALGALGQGMKQCVPCFNFISFTFGVWLSLVVRWRAAAGGRCRHDNEKQKQGVGQRTCEAGRRLCFARSRPRGARARHETMCPVFQFHIVYFRGVAQLGRALGSGPRGRKFESCHSDQRAERFALLFLYKCTGNHIKRYEHSLTETMRSGDFYLSLFLSIKYSYV